MGLGRRRYRLWIGAACAGTLFCCATKAALAQQGHHPQETIREFTLSDFFVPADLGYITDTFAPTPLASQPVLIHIQEAHTNYDAQQHIVAILERLIQQYGLRMILVEGGEGDLGLAYLRAYGSPENRREVADKYLKAGVVSAEEYLDIVSDYPLTIWGVEQKALYEDNVKAFMEAEQLAERFAPLLSQVQAAVEQLKPSIVDPAWLALEQQTTAFDAEELSIADYVDAVLASAEQHGLHLTEDDAPHLLRFTAIRKMEPQIDTAKVSQEQRRVFEQLAQQITETELTWLLDRAKQMQAGALAKETFYRELATEISAAGLSLDPLPHLARYVTYIEERSRLKPGALVQELREVAGRLKEMLTVTPAGRTLQAISEQADVIQKLLALKLSPNEYEQFEALAAETMFAEWRAFFAEQKGTGSIFSDFSELEAAIPRLQRFYTAANDRDGAIVSRALEKLRDSRERVAVLITGGFHSPRITQLLKDANVGVVVLTPRVDRPTDERLYRAVLKYKNGDGTLEDVLTLAGVEDD